MTVDEFKILKPEFQDWEGDALWNAMEDYMLRQQQGEEIIRTILPFWKRYTLRWMFYRRIPNMRFAKYSDKRCKHCKNGSGSRMIFLCFDKKNGRKTMCGCGKPLEYEPNTNLDYRMWKLTHRLSQLTIGNIWKTLSWLRIVRSSIHGRYEMFGDEARYVACFTLNIESYKSSYTLKDRPWWQYIFIEKPKLNI